MMASCKIQESKRKAWKDLQLIDDGKEVGEIW